VLGKTPEITLEQARTLIRSVDTGHVVGLWDRAILAYTVCRAGGDGQAAAGRLPARRDAVRAVIPGEGGKSREIPVRRDLDI